MTVDALSSGNSAAPALAGVSKPPGSDFTSWESGMGGKEARLLSDFSGQDRRAGRTSARQSTLNLVNCILGAGVLGYPYCFKSSGLLLATCIMLVSFLACRFSYQLLLYCSQLSSKRSYEDLAEQALGKAGRILVVLCTAAMNLGAIIAYLNILADVLSAVAGTIIPPGAEPSRSAYLAGVTMFGALPVALVVRDHSIVAAFSTASVAFVVLFAVVVVIFAAAPPAAAAAAGTLQFWRLDGLLVAFPVMAYTFTAHPYYLGIFSNLHSNSMKRMTRVTDMAMGLSGLLYWLVGFAGYMTFRSRTAGDLLRNFGAAHTTGLRGAYERAVKLCYGLSVLGSVPLCIMPFYNIFLPVLGYAGGRHPQGEARPKQRLSDSEDESIDNRPRAAARDSAGSATGPRRAGGGSMSGSSGGSSAAAAAAGGAGGGAAGREARHTQSDVVDLHLHPDSIHGGGAEDALPSASQHSLVVMLVLGLAMASAIWVPNLEFIYGLTGATASVLIAYILPSLTFMRLLDANPELVGQGGPKGLVTVTEQVRTEWVWRRRKALALLVFGIVSGITCTDAILSAVQEEAVVVQLAQQLVAHEAVVVETTRAQKKAKEAVAAVSVVQTASVQLDAAQANATNTLGKLQQAADALSAIANSSTATHAHHVWDISAVVKEHSQHVAESKVLHNVEDTLFKVQEEVEKTYGSVEAVVAQLDAAIVQIKAETAGGAAKATVPPLPSNATDASQGGSSSSTSAAVGGGGGSKDAASVAAGGASRTASGAAGSSSSTGSSSSSSNRVSDLALELGKALGVYSNVAQNGTAGKSLEQVRANAVSSLSALNQSRTFLSQVVSAVAMARRDHKHDGQVKELAAAAMQAALNVTATSTLAMKLTAEALRQSASEETDELLAILTQVASDLQKAKGKAAKAAGSSTGSSSTPGSGSGSGGGDAAAGAGAGTGTTAGSDSSSKEAAGAGAAAAKGGAVDAGAATAAKGSSDAATASTSGASGNAQAVDASKSAGGVDAGAKASGTGGSSSSAAASAGDGGKQDAVDSGTGSSSSSSSSGSGEKDAGSAASGEAAAAGSGAGGANSTATATASANKQKQKADALKKVILDLKDIVGTTNGTAVAAGGSSSSSSGAAAAGAVTAANATSISTAGGAAVGRKGGSGSSSSGSSSSSKSSGAASGSSSSSTATTTTTAAAGGAAADKAAASVASANATAGATADVGSSSDSSSNSMTDEDLQSVADVLKDAVALTEGSQQTVIQEIQNTLGKANTKVQERVVGILKDLSQTKKDVATAVASDAAAQEGAASGGTGAGGASGAAGSSSSRSGGGSSSNSSAAGPVVRVDAAGHYEQQEEQQTGPVVTRNQHRQSGAGGAAAGSSSSNGEGADVSREQAESLGRKFGGAA